MKLNISNLVITLFATAAVAGSAHGAAYLCGGDSTEYATCRPTTGAPEITNKYDTIKICQKPGKVWMIVQYEGGSISPLLPSVIGTSYLGVNTGSSILPGIKIQFLDNQPPGSINAYFWVRTRTHAYSAKGICYQHGLQTYPHISAL